MKTKTVNIYTIHELSEKAQEKAHYDYLSSGLDYFWMDEGLGSVRAFCDLFRIKVTDWSFDTCRRGDSYLLTDAEQAHFRGIKPIDILNKLPQHLHAIEEAMVQEFEDHAKRHGDIKGAFDAAIDQAKVWILNDMEYEESLEYFVDTAEANEWEYLEDGSSAWRCAA